MSQQDSPFLSSSSSNSSAPDDEDPSEAPAEYRSDQNQKPTLNRHGSSTHQRRPSPAAPYHHHHHQSPQSRSKSREHHHGRSHSRSRSRPRSYSSHSEEENAPGHENRQASRYHRRRDRSEDSRHSNPRWRSRSRSREHRNGAEFHSGHRHGSHAHGAPGNAPNGSGGYQNYRNEAGGRGGSRHVKDGHFQEGGLFVPSLSRPLVPYTQFASMQTRHIANLPQAYDRYKEDHSFNHAKAFLREHEFDQWFLERYNPLHKYQLAKELQTAARAVDLSEIDSYVDVNKWTAYVRNVPARMRRAAIKEALPGCTRIYASEPLRMFNFSRIFWLRFDSEASYHEALGDGQSRRVQCEDGDSFTLELKPSELQQPRRKSTPALPEDKISRDLQLATQVAEIFDSEMGTNLTQSLQAAEITSEESEELAKLDFVVRYLRRVHGYCFYAGLKADDERLLAIKTCLAYERVQLSPNQQCVQEAVDFESTYVAGAEAIILRGPRLQILSDPLGGEGDEVLADKQNQFCTENCVTVKEGEKYKCQLCQKGFRGSEFVHKHILNKHEDIVRDKIVSNHFKQLARDAYLSDPQKIENPPFSFTSGGAHSRSHYNEHYQGGSHWQDRGAGPNRGGREGRPYPRQRTEEAANGDAASTAGPGRNGLGGEEGEQAKREYIDYDDPMIGQQPGATATVTTVQSVNTGLGGAGLAKRGLEPQTQLVSYDDLF